MTAQDRAARALFAESRRLRYEAARLGIVPGDRLRLQADVMDRAALIVSALSTDDGRGSGDDMD